MANVPYRPLEVATSCRTATSVTPSCRLPGSAVGVAKPTVNVNVGFSFYNVNSFLFEQTDGPFVFPSSLFKIANNSFDYYFSRLDISGANRVKFAFLPNDPNLRSCDMSESVQPHGLSVTAFGGYLEVNPLTSVVSGLLSANLSIYGYLPSFTGAYYVPGGVKSYALSSQSLSSLLGQIGLRGGYLASKKKEVVLSSSYYQESYYTENQTVGYFVSGNLNSIYCNSYRYAFSYSNLVDFWDLGYPVVRTGDAAKTQNLVSYDSATRTFTGNKSKLSFSLSFFENTPELLGLFSFLVTPLSGSAYVQTIAKQWYPGLSLSDVIDFPTTLGTVQFLDYLFIRVQSLGDEFSTRIETDDFYSLAGDGEWLNNTEFLNLTPNATAWDSFFEPAEGLVSSLSTGSGWASDVIFSNNDNLNAADDFENYPIGVTFALTLGFGFTSPASLANPIELGSYDDLEAYTIGAISILTEGFAWNSDGTFFLPFEYPTYDDFESYSTGTITQLNGGVGWSANGTFF